MLGSFEKNYVEFLNCFPRFLGSSREDATDLFAASDPGARYQRLMTQLAGFGTIAWKGSLFDPGWPAQGMTAASRGGVGTGLPDGEL